MVFTIAYANFERTCLYLCYVVYPPDPRAACFSEVVVMLDREALTKFDRNPTSIQKATWKRVTSEQIRYMHGGLCLPGQ